MQANFEIFWMISLLANRKKHSCIIATFIKLCGYNYQKKHSSSSTFCFSSNGPKLQNIPEFIDYLLTMVN